VDKRKTADAVERFYLELRGYYGESSLTERGRTRPLNRILEATKIRRKLKRALSEQNERGPIFRTSGDKISRGDERANINLAAWCHRESVKGGGRDALNGVWDRRRKQRQRPPFSAAFPRIGSYCWFLEIASHV
jgi:hypothetical protein